MEQARGVGRDQEHIKLELVDNKSNNVMNGIAFGQSSQARYIKTKRSFSFPISRFSCLKARDHNRNHPRDGIAEYAAQQDKAP